MIEGLLGNSSEPSPPDRRKPRRTGCRGDRVRRLARTRALAQRRDRGVCRRDAHVCLRRLRRRARAPGILLHLDAALARRPRTQTCDRRTGEGRPARRLAGARERRYRDGRARLRRPARDRRVRGCLRGGERRTPGEPELGMLVAGSRRGRSSPANRSKPGCRAASRRRSGRSPASRRRARCDRCVLAMSMWLSFGTVLRIVCTCPGVVVARIVDSRYARARRSKNAAGVRPASVSARTIPGTACGTPTRLHRRGIAWIGNDAVNFAATATGALVAAALVLVLR